MFTTRSTCQPGPVTDRVRFAGDAASAASCAVMLVGHGSSRRPAAAACLERHARALRAMGVFGTVHTAFLIGGSSAPADVLQRIEQDPVVIVPMMMCPGWTALQVIPKALGLGPIGPLDKGRRIVMCQPIGLQPALAQLIGRRALEGAAARGISADSVTLLLIAHGSTRYSASQDAAELQATRLRKMAAFRKVETAYLEQSPRVPDILATLGGPTVAVGLFAAPGHHATVDLEALLSEYFAGDVTNLGPIGDDHEIPALVRSVVEDRLSDHVRDLVRSRLCRPIAKNR